jgi:hypothetical protein
LLLNNYRWLALHGFPADDHTISISTSVKIVEKELPITLAQALFSAEAGVISLKAYHRQ